MVIRAPGPSPQVRKQRAVDAEVIAMMAPTIPPGAPDHKKVRNHHLPQIVP